jgi:hypothetical protein
MADELTTLRNIRSSGDLNPIQAERLQQLETAGSSGNRFGIESTGVPTGGAGAGGYGTQDIIANAQKLRDFNIQSNQPAIQNLQTEKNSLTDRYTKLLESIKGQQGVAEDAQIRATSNEMGRRGINNQSGMYEQQQADALRPLAAQFQGLSAQTGLSQEKDMSEIARAIASMQSGNPEFAISTGQGIANQAQQAYQFAQSQDMQRQQMESDNSYRDAALKAQQQSDPYQVLSEGQVLLNKTTGLPLFTVPKTYKADGGSGSSGGAEAYYGTRYQRVG